MDLLQNNYTETVIKELKKRKKTTRSDLLVVFDFYYTALCHIQGSINEVSQFEDIITRADHPLRERLRRISRALSKIAPPYMKPAFETFNFQLLDPSSFLTDFLDDDFDDDWLPDAQLINDVIEDFFKNTPQKNSGIHLGNFEAKNVFGKNCDEKAFNTAVMDLADSADLLVNGPTAFGHEMKDIFMTDFSHLMSLIKKTDITSTNEFRQTGRKLTAELEYAKTIVQALDICKTEMTNRYVPEVQHFIMGMRTGI